MTSWNLSFAWKYSLSLHETGLQSYKLDINCATSWENLSSGVCDQVRLKQVCSATEASWSLEILVLASVGIRLSKQRTTKALIRLCGYAGWSEPLLFAYGINSFFHDLAQFCKNNKTYKIMWAPSWENLFLPYANNKGADQPAHLCSLISTFVVHCLDSTIPLLAIAEISRP